MALTLGGLVVVAAVAAFVAAYGYEGSPEGPTTDPPPGADVPSEGAGYQMPGRPRLATQGQAGGSHNARRVEADAWTVEIAGKVEDQHGHPITHGRVVPLVESPRVSVPDLEVGSGGTFAGTIRTTTAECLWLYYRDEAGWQSSGVRIDLAHGAQQRGIRLIARQGLTVHVDVVDADGRPAPDVLVTGQGVPSPVEGRTDAQGRVTLRMPYGALGFWARAPDGARGVSARALPETPGAEIHHRIRLGRPWREIPLRIVSTPSGSLAGMDARVSVIAMGRAQWLDATVDGPPVTLEVPVDCDVNGGVQLRDGGAYAFRWRGNGEKARQGIEIEVRELGSVRLTCIDDEGRLLANWRFGYGRRNAQGPTHVRRTDSRGMVTLEGLPYGSYDVYPGAIGAEPIGRFEVRARDQRSTIQWGRTTVLRGTWRLPASLSSAGPPTARLRGAFGVRDVRGVPDGTWSVVMEGRPEGRATGQLLIGDTAVGSPRAFNLQAPTVPLDAQGARRTRIALQIPEGRRLPRSASVRLVPCDVDATPQARWARQVDASSHDVVFYGIPPGCYRVLYSSDYFDEHVRILDAELAIDGVAVDRMYPVPR